MATNNNKKDEEYLGLPGEVNPHIPQYIADAPWYLAQGQGRSLHHQQKSSLVSKDGPRLSEWYQRGEKKSTIPLERRKFKKGACENCGATTHKKIDCVERPRAKSAKFTGKDIANDELVPTDLKLNWESKRDRYGGFDGQDFDLVLKKYKLHEEIGGEQEMKDNEDIALGVKNLRIREDTAKYLINLDTECAFYDPKTRSMRENPNAHLPEDQQGLHRGDNALLGTGESAHVAETEAFAWKAYRDVGSKLFHANACPTQVAIAMKKHKYKMDALVDRQKDNVLSRYDPENRLNKSLSQAREVIGSSTTEQRGYLVDGRREEIKALPEKASLYVENELDLDHTSVWGSWFNKETMKWGYRCCRSTERFINCKDIIAT
eukprot:GHVH01003658.1.p1 GENE.GHVH01003658.1~~GHVH01003658.1.p1  ORF type:complete len:388 (+),score=50.22 GHVH01003658.1:39-1166(+)